MHSNMSIPRLMSRLAPHRINISLALIVLFGIYLNLAFFYGPSWINGSDSYIYFTMSGTFSQGHFSQLNCGIVDCVNYIVFAGVGSFFALLGQSLFSAALFGILCYLLTILILYMIGRELHSPLAGLLSGLFYSVMPIVISQSSNVGDMIPMTMLISLSVLLLLIGIRKDKQKMRYLAASGFVAAINVLSVSEATLGILVIILYLVGLAAMKRDRKTAMGLISCLVGVGIALLIIGGIGIYETGNPLYVYNVYSHNYNAYFSSWHPAIGNYLSDLFPGNIGHMPSLDMAAFGYVGYAMLLCGFYLAAVRFTRGTIVAIWFAAPLAYLGGLGSLSLTRYMPVIYIGPRYSLAFVPAMVLIVGIGFAKLIETSMREERSSRAIIYALVIASTIFILFNSIVYSVYVQYSQLRATEPLLQIGSYINSLPQNATVYGPYAIPWSTYVNPDRHPMAFDYTQDEISCHDAISTFNMKPGSFLVGEVPDYKNCSMELVMVPAQISRLKNYTMFDNWGPNFYVYNIYRYAANSTS